MENANEVNPAKPSGISSKAVWIEEDKEWGLGKKNAEGKYIGEWKWWTEKGHLVCHTFFDDNGNINTYTRFHSDGTYSQKGSYKNGKQHGIAYYQKTFNEPEDPVSPIPPQAPDNVFSMIYEWNESQVVSARFFNQESVELDLHGNVLHMLLRGNIPEEGGWNRQNNECEKGEYKNGQSENLDKKAKEILFKTYWTSAGWIDDKNRRTGKSDFEYAKEKGLMFDPLTISEAELMHSLKRIFQNVSIKKITDAFLCSLTNKRLDWRSGLASYANAKRLLTEKNISDCHFGQGENIDLNVLNFERIKWGGVRHYSGLYNWLDLTLLDKGIVSSPTEQDIQIMKSILNVVDKSETGETPGKLRDRLKDAFNGSKNERGNIMEILACADILKPLRFDRKEPGKHDWDFVLYWRGEDKYDKENVRKYFAAYGIE